MKKLTLDKTWTECLRMWRWIPQQKGDIDDLKESWLRNKGYDYDNDFLDHDCFFCEYNIQRGGNGEDCEYCPGKKIDKSFNCCNDDYYYRLERLAFYNKLRSLNRKRLAKKKER